MTRRMWHPALGAWIVIVWVALWGEVSAANVLGGLVVAVGLLALFPSAGVRRGAPVRPLEILRYTGFFMWELVKSNIAVAWAVVAPGRVVREGIVAVPLQGRSDLLTTLFANSVTLTPGTLSLDVDTDGDGRVLYVHVLDIRDIAKTRRDLAYMEYRAIRAFGERDEREAAVDPRPRPGEAVP